MHGPGTIGDGMTEALRVNGHFQIDSDLVEGILADYFEVLKNLEALSFSSILIEKYPEVINRVFSI